jgi:hypothetical protein
MGRKPGDLLEPSRLDPLQGVEFDTNHSEDLRTHQNGEFGEHAYTMLDGRYATKHCHPLRLSNRLKLLQVNASS